MLTENSDSGIVFSSYWGYFKFIERKNPILLGSFNVYDWVGLMQEKNYRFDWTEV